MKFSIRKILTLSALCAQSLAFGQSVGSVDGVFNVSEMGSATYNIPIKVPDGIAGLQPNISLSYNSQGGNGSLGEGWILSGLSAISRTGNSVYHDKKVSGISLTMDDKFSLDGSRLILVGGTYGADGSTYRTEIESFKQITAIGNFGIWGPVSFTVKDQDGTLYEYGGDVQHQATTTANDCPYSWLLKKVTDLKGNYMTFSYSNYNGEALPVSICYNGNTSTSTATNSCVTFTYSANSDPNFFYVGGGMVKTTVRLTKIVSSQTVGTTNHTYRSYTLAYTDDMYSHLTSVTEKGVDEAESLPATQFQYGSQNVQNTVTQASPAVVTDGDYISGDFNGDGFQDYIKIPFDINGNESNSWQLNVNNGAGVFSNTISGGSNFTGTNIASANITIKAYNPGDQMSFSSNQFSTFDYDGDGKDDFVQYKITSTYSGSTLLYRKLYISVYKFVNNGTGYVCITPYYDLTNVMPYLGDFDGDGKSEILLINSNISTPGQNSFILGDSYGAHFPTTYLPNSTNLITVAPTPLNGLAFDAAYVPVNTTRINVIDYNADGKSDLLVTWGQHGDVYTLNTTFDANNNPVVNASSPFTTVKNNLGFPTIDHRTFFGDFNGDGVTDILAWKSSIGWQVGYGDGNGYFGGSLLSYPGLLTNADPQDPNTPIQQRPAIIVADFNGDGKSDVFWGGSNAGTMNYSKGSNTTTTEIVTFPAPTTPLAISDYETIDMNGDGAADLLFHRPNKPVETVTFRPNELRHLIVKVTNGLGETTQIQYKSLTDPSVSSVGTYTYPYISKPLPIKVASRTIADNGISTAGLPTSYYYSSLVYYAQGKGLLGFDKFTSFQESTGLRQEKGYQINPTYAYRTLANTYNTYNPNAQTNTAMSNVVYTSGLYSYGDLRIFPYPTSTVENNVLTGETKTTTYNYSFYTPPMTGDQGSPGSNYTGKPFSITTNKGSGLDVTTQTFSYPWRIPSNAQAASGQPYSPYTYINSKPYKVVTTNTRSGEPAYTRSINYSYDDITGLMSSLTNDIGTSNVSTTAFEYDAYANITRRLTTASSLLPVDERMSFDGSHRYAIQSYNAAYPNIINQATFDAVSGLKLSDVNPDGFWTYYDYDAFGRVKKTWDINSSLFTTTYTLGATSPADAAAVPNAVYYKKNLSNTGATVYTNYDRLGRELKNSTNNFQNVWVSTTQVYNNIGQLASTTKPSSTTSAQTTYNSYDAYGRLIQSSAPEGNTSISYSPPGGNFVVSTTNPAGQTSKVTTDASGAKISVTDAANNVMTYTYNSNGDVKTVSSGGVTLQTYLYDAFGRLKERQDPNYGSGTGSYLYTYDAYGQMLSQKDPKGNNYLYNYDALGRLYLKTGGPEGDHTWSYENNTGQNCGKLLSMTGNNGTTTYSYGYGNKVNSVDYDDNGTSFNATGTESFPSSTVMSYDAHGRVLYKQFATGALIIYEYSSNNGDLIGIYNPNTGHTLYSRTAENDYGQTTSYTQNLGSVDINTSQGFDQFGFFTQQKTTTSNGTVLRDYGYSFSSASGNLQGRKDAKYALAESFTTYDALNRLNTVSYQPNLGLSGLNFNYTANGNIAKKSDAGIFTYDQANRVSEITDFQDNISTKTQTADYTAFDKVNSITEAENQSYFLYGPEGDRNTMYTSNNGNIVSFKSYRPDIDREWTLNNGDRTLTYIKGPENHVVAIIVNENGTETEYAVLTDHLGSFTQIVDKDGNIVEEKSFDAWGRLRDPQSWQPYGPNLAMGQPSQIFDRGYSGHENLPCYGIINMNGRLYDPVMGRMFSPDPHIMGTDDLQGYNRYTYALNNPLKYNDPSGEWINFVIGAIIGGTINWATHGAHFNLQGLEYFGVGAAAGAVGAGIGAGISSALAGTGFTGAGAAASGFINSGLIGAGSGLGSGLISGAGNAAISGGNVLGGALKEGTMGLVGGGVFGALSGGLEAVAEGRDFMSGDPVEYRTIVDMNIPGVKQAGKMNCLCSDYEAIDKSFGGNITQADMRCELGGNPETDGVANTDAAATYSSLSGHQITSTTVPKLADAGSVESTLQKHMLDQERVLVDLPASAGNTAGHGVTMNSITAKYVNGVFRKYIYRVMDPAYGNITRISFSKLASALNFLFIHP